MKTAGLLSLLGFIDGSVVLGFMDGVVLGFTDGVELGFINGVALGFD